MTSIPAAMEAVHAGTSSKPSQVLAPKSDCPPLKTGILVAPFSQSQQMKFEPALCRDISVSSLSYYSSSAYVTKQVVVDLTSLGQPLRLLCNVVRIENISGVDVPMFIVGCEFVGPFGSDVGAS